jgi:hypothetical protein
LTSYVTVYIILGVIGYESEGLAMFHDQIELALGAERARDVRDAVRRRASSDPAQTPVTRVTLRYASAGDAEPLRALARLDSGVVPSGPALVAEVDGRLRAALPLDGAAPLADPAHRGAELLDLLRLRATQLSGSAQRA